MALTACNDITALRQAPAVQALIPLGEGALRSGRGTSARDDLKDTADWSNSVRSA